MLRDNMSLQKKEMQTARADIGDAAAVTANIDGRFHMLESEMHSVWKKITDDQVARDKAAADKPTPTMPVRIPHGHSHSLSQRLLHTSTRGDGFRCCASLFVCRCDVIVRLLMMQTGVLYVQGSQCFFYGFIHFLHLSLVHLHVCHL